jgi:RNA polymerase sigma-70 factor (ECF subfamily)
VTVWNRPAPATDPQLVVFAYETGPARLRTGTAIATTRRLAIAKTPRNAPTRSICRRPPRMSQTDLTPRIPTRSASSRRRESARRGPRSDLDRGGTTRLDPELIGAHLGPLLRAASTLCDSRESAEDLVQDTVARILARPRWLRGGDERAYLMQALRNTFLTSRRTAARRPHLVTTLEAFEPADRRTGARPEEAVITGQVFPAIARLPESFRLALVAVDIAGLSYGEAAQLLGAPEATITTRLYRARRRVAGELDPERLATRDRSAPASAAPVQPTTPQPRRAKRPGPSTPRQRPAHSRARTISRQQ